MIFYGPFVPLPISLVPHITAAKVDIRADVLPVGLRISDVYEKCISALAGNNNNIIYSFVNSTTREWHGRKGYILLQ